MVDLTSKSFYAPFAWQDYIYKKGNTKHKAISINADFTFKDNNGVKQYYKKGDYVIYIKPRVYKALRKDIFLSKFKEV